MTPARAWVAGLAGLLFAVASLPGCAPSDGDPIVEVDAGTPAAGVDESTTTALSDNENTTPSVETSPTSAAIESTTGDRGNPVAAGCDIGPVPASAGLDPFYTQGCRIDGFWVVANDVVDPEAIIRAAETVAPIFAADERLAPTLAAIGLRLGIIGRNQRTTEMPEYQDLNEAFPETDWDARARGLGATLERPLVSAGEENVLCLPDDRYLGEDILLHEFSHVLHEFGYTTLDSGFDDDLLTAYEVALDEGTWNGTYAETNHHEYWAEGVQSYFGRNLTAEPSDGIHGPIGTRAELEAADPALHTLIDRWLGGVELPARCR